MYSFSHAVGEAATTGRGFHYPTAVTLGQGGVVYVLNRSTEQNFTPHISKLTIGAPGEEELLCDFGEYGEKDGQFLWPTSVTLDREENVYVADEWLQRISIFDKNGKFLDKWGTPGNGDGELNHPSGMVFDQEDSLNIVDSFNDRVQKFTKDGTFLSKFGKKGSGEGELNFPWVITIDIQGNVYLADWENHRVQKFSPDGDFLATFGTFGTGSGDMKIRRRVKTLEPEWRFYYPTAVAFDHAASRIIVVDCQRYRLQIYNKDKDYVDPQFNL